MKCFASVIRDMKYPKLQEESLKNKVEQDYFAHFDCTEIIKNIDFAVKNKSGLLENYYLWAEAKADVADVCMVFPQNCGCNLVV